MFQRFLLCNYINKKKIFYVTVILTVKFQGDVVIIDGDRWVRKNFFLSKNQGVDNSGIAKLANIAQKMKKKITIYHHVVE